MRLIRTLAFVAALSATGLAQCNSPNGLALTYQGSRLGDPFSLNLAGTPNVAGLLGVDVSPGPVLTPIGTVCLGLSPALQLTPFTLNGAGQFSLAGTLPLQPSLNGLSLYLQAGAVDPTQPGGTALSNGRGATFRAPRLFFVSYGTESAIQPFAPGVWCTYDPITDSSILGPVTLPGAVRDAVFVPSLGWLVFLCNNPATGASIDCYDAATGAPALSIPLVSGSGPYRLGLVGTTLYLLKSAPPGGIDSYALPTGTPGISVSLSPPTSAYEMIIEPVSRTAYVHSANSSAGPKQIYVVNLVTGVQLPSIPGPSLNNPDEWLIVGTTLYLKWQLYNFFPAETAIQRIDTTTNVAFGPPVVLPGSGNGHALRYGPGSYGNTLFMTCANYFPPLIEIHPQTLLPVNHVPGSLSYTAEMLLSSGGTEWLMVVCTSLPSFCTTAKLASLRVPSMTMTTLSALPLFPVMGAVRNASLHKAVTIYPNSQVNPFATDPATPPAPGSSVFVPLPAIRKILVD